MDQPPTIPEPGSPAQSAATHGPASHPQTAGRVRAVGRDREHHVPARTRRLKLRLSPDEFADIESAARSAGLTPTGYAAEVTVATARQTPTPVTEPLRVALADLLDARAQLRRFGTNVHLAVSAFHHSGEVQDWLADAVSDTARAVARVDRAAALIAEELR